MVCVLVAVVVDSSNPKTCAPISQADGGAKL